MSSSRLSFPTRRSATPPARRRHRTLARRAQVSSSRRMPSLAAESLETRALLAVTATLTGSDLQISLGAADDVAYLSNDGTNYIVRGTGLSGYAAANASVNSVSVAGTAAANQSFTVAAGVAAVLTDPLTVAASVESSTVIGAIDTAGAVTIGSGAITLAANVTTTGKQDYQGNVGLVGIRTLSAGAGDVSFGGKVDSSPSLFADPDAYAAATVLTTAFPGITLSDVGTFPYANVSSALSGVSTPTTGDYAPTGNRVFGPSDWGAPDNVFKAAFASSVTSVSLDFAPNDNFDPNAYIEAYDASGNKVASATYPPAIPELSFVTLSVSAPSIAYILASFDPSGGNTGLLDNLRATLVTTPAASLTVNSSGTTTFAGVVGGTAALASLTTDAGGTTEINGGSITTSGAAGQLFNDAVLLGAGATLASTNGPITFGSTVDGAKSLALNAGTGKILFAVQVGSIKPLAGIDLQGAASTTFANTVSLDGAGANGYGLRIATGVDAVTLNTQGSLIRDFNTAGIEFAGGSKNSTISGVTIDGNGGSGDGIHFHTGDYAGTVIQSNTITSALFGIHLKDRLAVTNLTIGGDKTAVPSLGNAIYSNVIGIEVSAGDYTGTVIKGNSITKNDSGIYFEGDATVVTKNLTIGAGVGGNAAKYGNYVDSNTSDGIFVASGNYSGTVIGGGNEIGKNKFGMTLSGDMTALTIAQNSIGTLQDGTTNRGNTQYGIAVQAGDYSGTVIQSNAIAFNNDGIDLVAGNLAITNLTIGGDKTATPSLGNEIYSNVNDGVRADSGDYTGTVIQGNEITKNAFGILLSGGAFATTNLTIGGGLGGDGAKYGNLIESNTSDGVLVESGKYTGTVIGGGNEIGKNVIGIYLRDSVADLTIAQNSIGTLLDGTTNRGNTLYGIDIQAGDYTGTVIRSNAIAFNEVGGIYLNAARYSITNLTIGGDKTAATSEGNQIYSNGSDGIQADRGVYTGTVIQGNKVYTNTANGIYLNADGGKIGSLLIGAGVGGNAKFGNEIYSNTKDGILVGSAVGVAGVYTGTVIGDHNEITLNNQNGIELASGGATGLVISGNKIGTLADGTTDKGNKANGVLVTAGAYTGTSITTNAIAYNDLDGIRLAAAGSAITNLSIIGNSIYKNDSDGIQADKGTYTGTKIYLQNKISSNTAEGIYLAAAAGTLSNLQIGGDKTAATSEGNQIYSNKSDGIQADAGTYTGTVIRGNQITTNLGNGVYLNAAGGKIGSLAIGAGVGGVQQKYGNLIESQFHGIHVTNGTFTDTVIGDGNEIGLSNDAGIYLEGGVLQLRISGNAIGTLLDGTTDRGNLGYGVRIQSGDYTGTKIQSNAIAFNDAHGIYLAAGGNSITNLLIGGNTSPTPNLGNVIYKNDANGIATTSGDFKGTTIAGNTIRNNGNTTTHLGNGILVEGASLMIGWTADPSKTNTVGNTITGNALNGIEIKGPAAVNNSILSNSIYLNGYVDSPATKVFGDGIALTNGGNGGQIAPEILDVVKDNLTNTVRVQVRVKAAGKYYVQLFDNKIDDERGIFPADRDGFEGRTYVGDKPAQSTGTPTTDKPSIAGTLVDGNTLTTIEIPTARFTSGDWITATATAVDISSNKPTNTSAFSKAVQLSDMPVLAVGGDGSSSSWSSEYLFTVTNAATKTVLVTGLTGAATLSPAQIAILTGSTNSQIVLSQDGSGQPVTATITSAVASGSGVAMTLSSLSDLTGTPGAFVFGSTSLPAARLYDASLNEASRAPIPFTVAAGGTQLTLTGDQRSRITVGNTIGIQPTTPVPGTLVSRAVTAVTLSGGNTLVTIGSKIDDATTAGVLVLPFATVYDTTVEATPGSKITSMQQALMDGGTSKDQAAAFVTRFQGGIRTASADFDGDGYGDLVTAAGGIPAALAASYATTFGNAPRIVTIYSGRTGGSWTPTSVDVSSTFPNYTGGFLVTVGDVKTETSGSKNVTAELIIASTTMAGGNKVAIYDVKTAARGQKPTIDPTPSQVINVSATNVTGLVAAPFTSGSERSDIVLASTTATQQIYSNAYWTLNTSSLSIYREASSFATPATFFINSLVERQEVATPPAPTVLQNVFFFGAGLGAGDVDNVADQIPDLVLGAGSQGLGNFRVLSGAIMANPSQAAIDTALTNGYGFTQVSRGRTSANQWQPTGGPDYFVDYPVVGGFQVPPPLAAGANAPLSVTVVEKNGDDFRSEVFAAIGATNQLPSNEVRSLSWAPSTSPIAFTVAAGGVQLKLIGDQRSKLAINDTVWIEPTAPAGGTRVARYVTAVTLSGGDTFVTIASPIDATTTAGNYYPNVWRGATAFSVASDPPGTPAPGKVSLRFPIGGGLRLG